MKKRNISFLLLSFISLMLSGCNETELIKQSKNNLVINQVQKEQVEERQGTNMKEKKEIKEIEKLLFLQNNDTFARPVTYSEDVFIVNDNIGETVHVYENYELKYSMKDNFEKVLISPSGDSFVGVRKDFEKETFSLIKQSICEKIESSLFYKSDIPLNLIKWTNEGIYFNKGSWDEMQGVSDKNIYILKENGESEKILDTDEVLNKKILDIVDSWALIVDLSNKKFYKLNLRTKENIEVKGLIYAIDINDVFFYGSTDVLIGETCENEEYEVFLFKNGNKEIIKKGSLFGPVKNGFIYKKYIPDAENSEGEIYVKTLKGEF